MKKQIITATIAACIAGPALADFTFGNSERSVTVYGRGDLGIVHINDGNSVLANAGPALKPGTNNNIQTGADSWLGVNAQMKIDDDLISYVKVQQRFDVDTGTPSSATKQFQGWSYVGLRKIGLGSVEIGRQYSPSAYVALNADPFRWDTVANLSYITLGGASGPTSSYASTDGPRYKNSILIKSDEINSFKATAGYSFKEDNAGAGVGSEYGGALEYAKEKLYAGLGFDRTSSNPSGKFSTQGQKLLIATLSYDLGFVKPIASTTHLTLVNPLGIVNANVYSLGGVAPIGKGELKFAAIKVNQDGPSAVNYKKAGVGYHYWLKKVRSETETYSTKLYTDYTTAKADASDNPGHYTRTNAIDFGMMVSF